jgi:hypothetical protein
MEIEAGRKEYQILKIRANSALALKGKMIELLNNNVDLLTWVSTDMPGVDPNFNCHLLSIKQGCKPFAQKKIRMGLEREEAIKK